MHNVDENAKVIIIYSLNPARENSTLLETPNRGKTSRTFLFAGRISNAVQVGPHSALHWSSRLVLLPSGAWGLLGQELTFLARPLWGAPEVSTSGLWSPLCLEVAV